MGAAAAVCVVYCVVYCVVHFGGRAVRMVMTFWLNQLEIRGQVCTLQEEQKLGYTIWDMIYSRLTEKGINNYKKVFADRQEINGISGTQKNISPQNN